MLTRPGRGEGKAPTVSLSGALVLALIVLASGLSSCTDLDRAADSGTEAPPSTATLTTLGQDRQTSPTPVPAVITTEDGERIMLESAEQAELVAYVYRLETVVGPAEENLATWKEISREVSLGRVSDSDYHGFLLQAREAFHSLASRLDGVAYPDAARDAHELYVSALRNRGDAMGHLAE